MMKSFSILILLFGLFFSGCGQQYSEKTTPKALNGILDLSDWDFSKDGSVKLEGEWEMYQGQLLVPSDFDAGSTFNKNKPLQYKIVPLRKANIDLPEFLTYRLNIKINASKEKLAFRFYMNKPGKIWINKQLVLLNGINAEDQLSTVTPKTNYKLEDEVVTLPTLDKNHDHYEIIIQVAKISHLYDFPSPFIGTENQIRKKYNENIYLYLIFSSAIFIMGIYHFVLFYLRKDNLSTLFLGLFCISISFAALVQTPPFIIYLFFPDVRVIWPFFIIDQAYGISTIFFTLYIRDIFPKETPRIAIKICYLLAGCFLSLSFLNILYLNSSTFNNTVVLKLYSLRPYLSLLMVLLDVLSLIIYFYISYKALKNKREGSKIFFTGFGILFVVTFQRLIIESFNLPYIFIGIVEGFFCFLFFQAVLIAQNFSRAYLKVSSLSKDLSSANQNLQNHSVALLDSNQTLKQEIIERQKTELSLLESEGKYRSMMESMKDLVYICSSEMRVEYMNPAMIDRIGRDASGELCYKAIYDRDEKCSWCVFDQVKKGETVDYEVANPKDNHYYSVSNAPISHTDGTVSKLTIFHDITEIKTMEENLRQSQKMESIGTLTGGIAHDFNNIMGIILGNAELALNDVPKWNPAHSNLKEIKTASLRAANIVRQLLSFSRKTDQKLQPMEIAIVIKDALKFLRSTIPTTIDIEQDIFVTNETILADPTQINQIMMNLCINASHAMEQTGGNLTISVDNVLLDDHSAKDYPDLKSGKYVKVMVGDTGPGIDPKIIDRIFDPYFTTKGVGKGSGMGLAVVHGIVKNHSGAITVDSSPGKGTTFSILFPLAQGKAAVEEETNQEIPTGHETILFVDDEISIVTMVQRMFERLGYKVETATTPQDALDQFALNSDHFDLVITDMTMPQMTGVALSEKLMDIRPDIPIIVCTGHSALVDEEKAKELGLAAYIMKPIDMQETAQTIRKVLDKK